MTRLHLTSIVLLVLSVGLLLTGCDSFKKTTTSNKTNPSSKPTKVSVSKPSATATTTLLKSTATNGVKTFVLSDLDSKTLSSDDMRQLDALAKEIKAIGSCQVSVIGHADNTGTSETNEAVSKERARLVGNYLKKKGVANITTSGESYNHPVAGNDTAAGRAKNRRVEVYVSTVGKYDPYK